MNHFDLHVRTPILALAMVLASCAGHAEIYKWVDAKGQIHYSERKADSNGARTTEVNVPPAPSPPPPTLAMPADGPHTPNRFAEPSQTPQPKPHPAPANNVPRSLSGGREHGTHASRCALAKDVLSGAVVHGNGKPTDKYDREVAQSDVKTFCNNR